MPTPESSERPPLSIDDFLTPSVPHQKVSRKMLERVSRIGWNRVEQLEAALAPFAAIHQQVIAGDRACPMCGYYPEPQNAPVHDDWCPVVRAHTLLERRSL